MGGGDDYWTEWLRDQGPLAGTWALFGTSLRVDIAEVEGRLRIRSNGGIEATEVAFDGERLTFTLALPEWGWSSTSELTVRSSHLLAGRSAECAEVWVRLLPQEARGRAPA